MLTNSRRENRTGFILKTCLVSLANPYILDFIYIESHKRTYLDKLSLLCFTFSLPIMRKNNANNFKNYNCHDNSTFLIVEKERDNIFLSCKQNIIYNVITYASIKLLKLLCGSLVQNLKTVRTSLDKKYLKYLCIFVLIIKFRYLSDSYFWVSISTFRCRNFNLFSISSLLIIKQEQSIWRIAMFSWNLPLRLDVIEVSVKQLRTQLFAIRFVDYFQLQSKKQ